MLNQVGRSRIGQAVNQFRQDIVRVMQKNIGGRFRGPKVLPSTQHRVVMLGQEAMKFPSKGHDIVLGVVDAGMVVVAHGHGPQHLNAGFLRGNGQAVEKGLIRLFRWLQEELTLGTTTAQKPDTAFGDIAGHGHQPQFGQFRAVLPQKVTPVEIGRNSGSWN